MEWYLLINLFFIIALVYASVGFGGGSSYLALLAVVGISLVVMRPTALLCNLVVVAGGTWVFIREGQVHWKRVWPFLISSVPLSFWGATISFPREEIYFRILGWSLLVAAPFLWIQPTEPQSSSRTFPVSLSLLLGGVIGFVSGLVSIGGGIFLSPVLYFLGWGRAREISAAASLFILVNSLSGLAGQWQQVQTLPWRFVLPLLVAVVAGGQIGSRLGARKFDPLWIRRITAVLIAVAAVFVLRDHWFY
ncbi:MAG: sulfite exporter TauE/SafE family protein [Cyclobacteriaceae bacterium]